MRIPRWGICLLGVGCSGFVGCSQTGWLRPNGPTDLKTVTAVDGKPVSTAVGEPGTGTARREDVDDLGPPPAAGARISGRVFDEDGRAVPNARVRLAVGGSTGGPVNFATTDRSGAFTLHGLRPGRDYTLIAEYQAEDGMMSGRVRARAPETGVRLSLGARDPASEPRGSKNLSGRVRSTLFPENSADDFPVAARPKVRQAEDQSAGDPPAEEAMAYSPRTKHASTAKLAATTPSTAVRAGWTVREQPTAAPGRGARRRDDADDPRDGPPGPDDRGGDDGENPLPPALEPVGTSTPRPAGRGEVGAASNARKPRPRRAAAAQDEGDGLAEREPGSSGAPPRTIPEDAFTPATDAEARTARQSADDAADPSPRRTTARRGSRIAAPAATRPREAARPDGEDDGSQEESPSRRRQGRRPTWRELSISPDEVPVDEALRRSSAEEEDDDPEAVIRAGGPSARHSGGGPAEPTMDDEVGAAREPEDGPEPMPIADEVRTRRTRPPSAAPLVAQRATTAAGHTEPACRLDAGHRRIAELRLPGLDGKPISLADIDADLILLDFWGSWCRECRKSIEHHREIQEQIGSKTLQVVGIACEKGATFEARRDATIAAARKLGINYPVLVTAMDGTCPVQKALQVQFYPSMVLLDREGNILQFEQGATDATLGRIDRAIAKAVRDGRRRDGD